MKKYNMSEIMTKAWEIYRMNKIVTEEYRKTFSECLQISWKFAKYDAKINAQLENGTRKVINGGVVWMNKVNCMADAGRPGWAVTGKTYGAKTELRKMGFHWDVEGRCWTTDDRQVARKFAAC